METSTTYVRFLNNAGQRLFYANEACGVILPAFEIGVLEGGITLARCLAASPEISFQRWLADSEEPPPRPVFGDPKRFFKALVKPNLATCTACHLFDPDASFYLSASADSDEWFVNVRDAWTKLGKGVLDNRLLTLPSEASPIHSGEQFWPVGSQPYVAMRDLLACFDNTAACAGL